MFSKFYLEPPQWLILEILKIKSQRKSDTVANGTGWRGNDLFKGNEDFKSIIDYLEKLLGKKIIRYWINVNDRGEVNTWHNHYTASEVGVWYLQTTTQSGDIEFKMNNDIQRYTPVLGDVIVFSGMLDHRVLENKTDHGRISVAFNFK